MKLDTTVLVDAERGGDLLGDAIDDSDDVVVAAVTVAELRVGVQERRVVSSDQSGFAGLPGVLLASGFG